MTKIKLWLYDNPLTENPNDYSAKVSSAGSLNLDDVVDGIIANRSEYQPETIRSIGTLIFNEIGDKLKDGYNINTPLFSASLAVSGVFNSKTASFSGSNHKLKINLRTHGAFLAELQKLEVEVLGVADVGGVIGKVIDSQTAEEDSTITPNDVIQIEGTKIKVEGEADTVGAFLVNQTNSVRVKMDRIVSNNPSELLVLLPALDTGDYQLQIVTQHSGGGVLLQAPRTIIFDHLLTVL
nr:DNA-binding domain-containing protein [uncultured Carboxylicivirga sp.]